MDSTYGNAIDLLRIFMRGQTMGAMTHPDDDIVATLLYALRTDAGDFDSKRSASFPMRDESTSKSLWWSNRNRPRPRPEAPEVFSFSNGMSGLATLAFVIPHLGAFASAGITSVKEVVENIGKRLAWDVKMSEVTNPPVDPYQKIVDSVKAAIADESVQRDISSVFVKVHKIQNMLSRVLIDPKHAAAAASGGIKTDIALDKGTILGDQGLGTVFQLLDSDEWGRLMDGNQDWVKRNIESLLHTNPTYADVTLNAVAHASITVVNGLLAYAFLYALPNEAFAPGWDHMIKSGSQRVPYVAMAQVKASKGTHPPVEYPHTAWTALLVLQDLLNPNPLAPNLMTRLGSVGVAWQQIFSRLSQIKFNTGQAGNRNGMWYLETDKTPPNVQVTPHMAYGTSHFNKWDSATSYICADGQYACSDALLHASPADAFLEPYRNFQTKLSQGWWVAADTGSVITGFLTLGIGTGGTAVLVAGLNANFNEFFYPLVRGGNRYGSDVSSNEVFFMPGEGQTVTPWGKQELVAKPTLGWFLHSRAALDLCAYVSFVLSHYAQAHHFMIDTALGINLLGFVDNLMQTYGSYFNVVSTALYGKSVDPTTVQSVRQGKGERVGCFTSTWPNGHAYVFRGDRYVQVDPETGARTESGPRGMRGFWRGVFPGGVDAVVLAPGNLAYFFRGPYCIKYDIASNSAAGEPQLIEVMWNGLPAGFGNGLDAAVAWPDGSAYLFQGSKCVRVDLAKLSCMEEVPSPIAEVFSGLSDPFASDLESVAIWNEGKAIFIKDQKYISFDIATHQADFSDPRFNLPWEAYDWFDSL